MCEWENTQGKITSLCCNILSDYILSNICRIDTFSLPHSGRRRGRRGGKGGGPFVSRLIRQRVHRGPGNDAWRGPIQTSPNDGCQQEASYLMEMEKSLAAMEAAIDRDSLQESDSSDETSSLDRDRRPRAKRLASENPFSRVLSPPSRDGIELGDLTPPSSEHRLLTQQEEELGGGEGEEAGEGDRMPDLVASGSSLPPDIVAPDIMARGAGLRPDLATGVTGHSRAVDLLDSANAAMPTAVRSPLDLTEGLTHLRGEGGQDGEGEGEGSKQHRET